MRISEFIDRDLKEFSNSDNIRSIPSVVDGFKTSQRQAVYGALQYGNKESRVSQLSSHVSVLVHYAHGETSLADTIVGLAQDFVGSNNLNLLEPIGQFGSILNSKSAAHRYIYTKPSKQLREYIRQEDDCILEHHYEDGDKTEPKNFYPTIPMWLVNGAIGIGTGHSVKILPRSPESVKEAIGIFLEGDPNCDEKTLLELLKPHFDGWKGTIRSSDGEGKYEIIGVLIKENTTTINVTELPVGYGVDKFKSILVDLMDKGSVKDFDNNSTEEGFNFTIKVPRDVGKMSEGELIDLFKLRVRVTENLTMWSSLGKLYKYESPLDALNDFLHSRLEAYETRRLTHMSMLEDEIDFLENKKKFILEWNGLENPGKMKTKEIEKHMVSSGVKDEYISRLMSLRISSLTMDLMKELDKEIKDRHSRFRKLHKTNAEKMYLEDLK